MSYQKTLLIGPSSFAELSRAADIGSSEHYARQSPYGLDSPVAPLALHPASPLAQVLAVQALNELPFPRRQTAELAESLDSFDPIPVPHVR